MQYFIQYLDGTSAQLPNAFGMCLAIKFPDLVETHGEVVWINEPG